MTKKQKGIKWKMKPILFSKRKQIEEDYKIWIKENNVKDCAFSAITYTVIQFEKQIEQLEKQLAEKDAYIQDQKFFEYKKLFEMSKDVIEDLEKDIDVLEKENQDKIKEIETLKEDYRICNNLRKLEFEINNNYRSKKYSLDKPVEELRKIKLSMPEKEWYYKGFDNCERQFASHIAELTLKLKTFRHEICEEIRTSIYPYHTGMFYHNGQKTITLSRLHKILNKIEEETK